MKTSNLVCVPPVKELLTIENYKSWRVWIKNCLLGQDLWDVVRYPADHSNPVSRRKNATALHAIQMSCGPQALSYIMDIPSAKLAWDALTNYYLSSVHLYSSDSSVSGEQYAPLHKAVQRGDWNAANEFLKDHPEGISFVTGIQIKPGCATKDTRINISKSNAREIDDNMSKKPSLLHQLVEYIFNFLGGNNQNTEGSHGTRLVEVFHLKQDSWPYYSSDFCKGCMGDP
ncbi:hypothetical protein L6164_008558 [Bauhinia variegata]|uniref:Uncharacterized protein n=1 Tax=Bauhinia variegata TaxID=167791 RepID=A0ACB9PGV5_BAUVA|nr:hypothetical protein L6164_008558 [Bauhinia variegata]